VKVLVVDDQRAARWVLRRMLADAGGFEVTEAATLDEARAAAAAQVPDVALVDLRIGDDPRNRDGLVLVRELRARGGTIPIVVSSFGELAEVRATMRHGAGSYLLKEELSPELVLATIRALVDDARGPAAAGPSIVVGDKTLLVADAAMRRAYALAGRLARSEIPVLVSGETGTGKEGVARAIHVWSPRAAGPLVSFNCAAVPETLVESELFGHERGAFTGAAAARPGLLEAASGGTLFLDEIGDLSPVAQAKLLRVLETRRVTRVGDVRERPVDLRLVSATNRDLTVDIQAGRFRLDLYYRVGAAQIALPPLRDRPGEIVPLARAFLADAARRGGRPGLSLAPDAEARLLAHPFPGNVRELRNLMECAAATAPGTTVIAADLGPSPAARAPAPAPPADRVRSVRDEVRELEKQRMLAALAACGEVRNRAAALIGMPLRTFVWKMKRYGIA
jgi:two-component system response regulator AtoC